MTARRVDMREFAVRDLIAIADHYTDEGGGDLGLRFVDDAERVIRRLARTPSVGSLQFAYDLGIPGLRAVSIARFPYVVLYLAEDDRIDVWRSLHSRRDFRAIVTDGDG